MLHEILKERLALLKIGGVGISVKPEFPLLKIGRQPSPRRAAAGQRRMIHAAEHLHALPLRDRRNRLQALLLGLMRPAPEAEEDHAGYRQNQQQAHPAQLIGGAAGTLIDPDCHHNADELQERIYEAGFLFQKMHQQQCHSDLRQHRQGAHQQTGSRRRSAALSVHDFYGTFCPCCRLQILTISVHQEGSLKYYSKHFHLLQPLFPLTSKSAVLRTVQFSICSQPLSRSCSPYERKTAQFAP